jgi:hypothetical protein
MFAIAIATVGALAWMAVQASASGCNGPFCNQSRYPKQYTLFGCHKGPQPTFQAAPWYLYWPYDGHFMTPAPVQGAFYGPPTAGNFPVNPYYPGPAAIPPGYGGPAPRP